jgi:hypothetical protein
VAGTFNTTDIIELYKDRFQEGVGHVLPTKSDLFAIFPNESDKSQDNWIKVITSNAVRRSSRGETAISRRNAPNYKAFKIQLENMADEFAVVSVPLKAAESCTTEAALLKIIEDAVDEMLKAIALSLEHKLGTDGGGSRARVKASSVSGSTFKLENADHRYFFYEGMILQASTDNGKGTSPAGVRSGTLEVVGIAFDGTDCTITVDQAPATGIPGFDDTGAGATDFIFEEDDYDNDEERILQGVKAWNPATAPAATPLWYGVDRSVNVAAYAGSRTVGNSAHVFDVLRQAMGDVRIARGKPNTLLVGIQKDEEIEQAIGAKQEFQMTTQYPNVGVMGYKIHTGGMMLDVVATPAYDSLTSNLLKREDFILGSIGAVPHEVGYGETWKVEDSKFAIQSRQEAYIQSMMTEPWHACHITW